MMKKLLLTAAFAVLAAGAASAAVTIGETSYNTIGDAVKAAKAGDVIKFDGTQEVNDRLTIGVDLTIEGSADATIKMTNAGKALLLVNNSANATVNNVIFDGNDLTLTNNKPVEIANAAASATFTNCTFKNFNAQRVIFTQKKTTLTGVKMENCTITANSNGGYWAEVFVGSGNNNVTIAGESSYTLMLEKNNAVTAGEALSGNIEIIPVYTAGATLVKGCTDTSIFSLPEGAPEGYKLAAEGGNIVLAFEKMVVKNETTGVEYSSLMAAYNAAEDNQTLVVLEDVTLGDRILNAKRNLVIKGLTPEVKITKTFTGKLFFCADKGNLTLQDLVLDCDNKATSTPELEVNVTNFYITNVKIINSVSSNCLLNIKSGNKNGILNGFTQENCTGGINVSGVLQMQGNNNVPVTVADGGSIKVIGELTNEQPIEITLPATAKADDLAISGTTAYRKFHLTNEGLYLVPDANGENLILSVNKPTGIEDITVDENAPVEYFNLQGVRVANPENGLYIRRQGGKATKVYVK